MYRIMLVDDEDNVLKSITRSLRDHQDWVIETYSSPNDALVRAKSCNFDVVISDFNMPDKNGIEFLAEIRELQPEAKRIILTGHSRSEIIMDALNKAHAYSFITKPWSNEDLIKTISESRSSFIPFMTDQELPTNK